MEKQVSIVSSVDSQEWTIMLIVACITITGSSSLSYGYGIGAPNMYAQFTEPFLRQQYDICEVDNNAIRRAHNCSNIDYPIGHDNTSHKNKKFDPRQEIVNGLPQTIFIIGCFIGSLTGSMWSKLGPFWTRRNVFLINLPIVYLAAIFVILSHYVQIGFLFYVGRLLHGYQSGMACAIVPPYISEISPQSVRGSAGVLHQCFITIGILCGQVFGLSELLGRYRFWSIGMSLMVIPCVFANVILFWLPQSPNEMLVRYDRRDEAVRALHDLRQIVSPKGFF